MAATSAGHWTLPAAMLSGAELHQELSRLPPAGPGAIQHQLLLPSAARAGTGSGAALAPGTVTLLRRVRGGCRGAVASPPRAPSMTSMRPACRVQTCRGQFPLRLARANCLPAKATGAKCFTSATTVAEAQWLADHGADAVIAQGLEAGGHRGHFLSEDPLAAGHLYPSATGSGGGGSRSSPPGHSRRQGDQAAWHWGPAQSRWERRFLCCHEATTSPLHRAALQGRHGQHTALTNLFSGRPARA